jgi:hypothetical protein
VDGPDLLTDELSVVLTCGIAFFLGLSAVMKLLSPTSVEPFVRELGFTRVPAAAIALAVSVVELAAAVGLLVRPRWGWLLAFLLLASFSAVLALVLRRGSRPRCGCLGDLSAASVGPAQLVRNAVLMSALLLTLQGPADRPLEAIPAALVIAALSVVVPEAIETMVEFRAASRAEIAHTRAERGTR